MELVPEVRAVDEDRNRRILLNRLMETLNGPKLPTPHLLWPLPRLPRVTQELASARQRLLVGEDVKAALPLTETEQHAVARSCRCGSLLLLPSLASTSSIQITHNLALMHEAVQHLN